MSAVAAADVPRGTSGEFGDLVRPGESLERARIRIDGTRRATRVFGSDAGQALLDAINHGRGDEIPVPLASVDDPPPPAAARLAELPLDLVDVGENVRVDPGEIDELAASIAELGVLQPVRAVGPGRDGRYRLVWGQRRYLASLRAGRTTIPALVEPSADVDAPGARRSVEQLAENLQRKDLNPIEEAVALRAVLEADPALTQAELARRLGRSAPWVSNTLRLLDAEEVVQVAVREGAITASHAKALVTLPAADQGSFVERVKQGLSAHQLENEIRWKLDANKAREATRERTEKAVPKAIAALEAAAVAKTSKVYVVGAYNFESGIVEKAIRKAGWQVDGRTWATLADPPCECAVVRLVFGRTWTVEAGCESAEHRAGRSRAMRQDDDDRRAEIAAKLEELTAIVDRHLVDLPPALLRLMAAGSLREMQQLAADDAALPDVRRLAARRIADAADTTFAWGDARAAADAALDAVLAALRPAEEAS